MFWNKLGKNWTNGGNVWLNGLLSHLLSFSKKECGRKERREVSQKLSIWFLEQARNGKYFKPTLRSGPIIENIGTRAVSFSKLFKH